MTHRLNMYKTARLAPVVGLAGLAPGLASAQAPHCSTLAGTYAAIATGTLPIPGNTVPAPFNAVAIQTFEGAGKWTTTESANFNGTIRRNATLSGTHTLNPNCTGIMTATFPDGSLGHQDFVIADGGKTIYAIGVDNGGRQHVNHHVHENAADLVVVSIRRL